MFPETHANVSLYFTALSLVKSGTTLTILMGHETTGHCGTHHWEWMMKMFVYAFSVLCGCV